MPDEEPLSNLYILYGADQYRRHQRVNAIREQLGPDSEVLANNTSRYDALEAKTLKPSELQNACQAASFFETSRLVIIDGLQARFAAAASRAQRRRSSAPDDEAGADEDPSGGQALPFFEVLLNLPPTTTVILTDDKTGVVVTQLPKLAEARYGKGSNYLSVETFPELKGQFLMNWALERASAAGYQFAPAAMNRLLTMVDGAHTGELANEIDKIGAYAAGRTVTVQDVDAMASLAISYMPWDITDPVVEGRTDRALRTMQATGDDFHPMVVLAMLRNQFRRLLLVQSMTRDGVPQGEIARRMGMKEFPLKKALEQGGRFPDDSLERAFRRILKADADVKTGVMSIEVVLPTLIVEIAELQRRQPGRPAATAVRR